MADRDVDVVIIGAGISGLNAAYRLQERCPSITYTILENRDDIGGTWDLFKYPGIRSDSDLHTFGFAWRPWHDPNPIAEAASIKKYLKQSIALYGIDQKIRFRRRVDSANWSSKTSTWTLETTDLSGEKEMQRQVRCNYVVFATGYYDYHNPLKPDIPGIDSFAGTIVHPQFWPEDLDVRDKKVVIIGSGATAVTILPAVADQVKEVTMLQRSPGYVLSLPQQDSMAEVMKWFLPSSWVYRFQRVKFLLFATLLYSFCQAFPRIAKKLLQNLAQRQLPKGSPIDPNFNPVYYPWDQRLCMCPDGDFFTALRHSPNTRVVTDTIKEVQPHGIQLAQSEKTLAADIIVTATGLRLAFGGLVQISIDGTAVDLSQRKLWKSTLIEGIPNAALSIGYINNSWTLGADCAATIITRMLNHMRQHHLSSATPQIPSHLDVGDAPILNLNSTYVAKAADHIPKAGTKGAWRPRQTYFADMYSAKFGNLAENIVFA